MVTKLANLLQAWPAKIFGLLVPILFVWLSFVLLAILIDPNFPDDVSVNFDRVPHY
jgi:hypothetical protein